MARLSEQGGRTTCGLGPVLRPPDDAPAAAEVRWRLERVLGLLQRPGARQTCCAPLTAARASARPARTLAPPFCGEYAGCYWGFLGPCAGFAIDTAETIVVAYNAGRTFLEPQPMFARTSHDGLHWTPAQEISVADSDADNAFPAVVAGPLPHEVGG